MKKMIEFDKKGHIIRGAYEGWYVLVKDDTVDTGGYYIFISNSPNVEGIEGFDDGAEGFDNWFENKDQVQAYFEQSDWLVEWIGKNEETAGEKLDRLD
jgi:hypothetical protein